MNKKLLKKRRKLHKLIITLISVFCVLFIAFAAVFTYKSTQSNLYSKSYIVCMNLYEQIKSNIVDAAPLPEDTVVISPWTNYYGNASMMYGVNNLAQDYTGVDTDNIYVYVTDNKKYVVETGNNLPTNYYNNENINAYSYIAYDSFKKSMTDEQYQKISAYLNSTPEEEGYRYLLVCTDYYDSKYNGVLPKQVEILKTCDDNTWYIQDEKVEQFDLSPDLPDEYKHEKIGDMYRNEINADFFFGKYAKNFTREDIERAIPNYVDIGTGTIGTDLFEFITLESGELYDTDRSYQTLCAFRYNVLDECLGTIIVISLVILLFFGIIGALEMAMWRISKTKALQEQSRIDMTNAVAHNLKTPLFVISGFSENLKGETDRDKKFHYIEVIQQQTREMNTLVHRMIDLSKLDSPQSNLSEEKFSLTNFVSELLTDYRMCSESEIVLNSENDTYITADKEVMKMALENLIDNAIKYTELYSDIVIDISKGYFSISNKCKPLTADKLKKLWQPYYRQTDGDNTSGNGIGLSIVKSAFELHKFKYGADYRSGKIYFWFSF